MWSDSSVYRVTAHGADSPFRQGELLTNVVHVCLDLASSNEENLAVVAVTHPLAIILTQDCDLEQDFRAHFGSNQPDKQIPSILFAEVYAAEELRGGTGINSTIWQSIRQNKNERYQFLQKVEPACDAHQEGLPELAIDFKKYFTLPRDEIYHRVAAGETKRRCVMTSPYLEHLATRFAYYLSRVALPGEHFSEPAPPRPGESPPHKPG